MLQDGQPSTRQLLNSSQAIVASYINDSFGNSVSSSGSAANPFKWNGGSGYYSDAESGLQKVGARYYDPSVGSWLSQDTMLIAGSPADSQSVNRYLYCGANPIGRVDPSGRVDREEEALWTRIFVALLTINAVLSKKQFWRVAAAFAGLYAAVQALYFYEEAKHAHDRPPPYVPGSPPEYNENWGPTVGGFGNNPDPPDPGPGGFSIPPVHG